MAFVIPVNVTLFDRSFNSSSTMLPLDSSPGGIFDIADFGGAPDDLGLPSSVFKNNINLAFEETAFSFIPTTSSLDIGSGSQPIVSNDLARSYSPIAPPQSPKNTPFDNFFTNPIINENHIQFTLNNGNWLLEELRGNDAFYSCIGSCDTEPNITINGNTSVCTVNSSYSIANPPLGGTIQWSKSSNLTYVSGQGTNSYVVKASSTSTQGSGWVRATIISNCGSISNQKEFWVGKPSTPGRVTGPLSPNVGYVSLYQSDALSNGATSHQWSLPSNGRFDTYQWSINTVNSTQSIFVNVGQNSGYVQFIGKNACGNSSPSRVYVTPTGSGGDCNRCELLVADISPNPSSDILNVNLNNEKIDSLQVNKSKNSFSYSLSNQNDALLNYAIYDKDGFIVLDQSTSLNDFQINVSVLDEGTYYLNIIIDENTSETYRILIER